MHIHTVTCTLGGQTGSFRAHLRTECGRNFARLGARYYFNMIVLIVVSGCGRTSLELNYPDGAMPLDTFVIESSADVRDDRLGSSDGDAAADVVDADRRVIPTDAARCTSTEFFVGKIECTFAFRALGVPIANGNEEVACCQGICYLAGACSSNGPLPARCDLTPRPCEITEACCFNADDRLFCANRQTREGCFP